MFESNYTCHFFRLWGYEEGKKGLLLQDALLGNMQNDFDAKLGDLCADIGSRYFIIEFKTNREGFNKEISSSGKLHRGYLYQHLRDDSLCRSIARQGHFGAYANSKHQLVFEPYAHCPAIHRTNKELVDEQLSVSAQPWHEMDYQAWVSDFKTFYQDIAKYQPRLCESKLGFFEEGLGVTRTHLDNYIQCMYQHLEFIEDDTGESIFGAFSPLTGKFVAFKGSIIELVKRLHHYFAELKSSQTDGLTFRSNEPCP